MYYYIYDEFTQEDKYEKELLKIENRLSDLGLLGNIARLALFKQADEFIREEVRRGVTTVVVVGNDKTIYKILDVVAEEKLLFGIIPLGPENFLAQSLGIPEGVAACDTLSARMIQTIDTGILNGKRFIAEVHIPETIVEITCADNYRVKPQKKGTVEVRNFSFWKDEQESLLLSNPCDGFLETVIKVDYSKKWWFKKKKTGITRLPLQTCTIRSPKPVIAFADGKEIQSARFDISVDPLSLRVIIGKERVF